MPSRVCMHTSQPAALPWAWPCDEVELLATPLQAPQRCAYAYPYARGRVGTRTESIVCLWVDRCISGGQGMHACLQSCILHMSACDQVVQADQKGQGRQLCCARASLQHVRLMLGMPSQSPPCIMLGWGGPRRGVQQAWRRSWRRQCTGARWGTGAAGACTPSRAPPSSPGPKSRCASPAGGCRAWGQVYLWCLGPVSVRGGETYRHAGGYGCKDRMLVCMSHEWDPAACPRTLPASPPSHAYCLHGSVNQTHS